MVPRQAVYEQYKIKARLHHMRTLTPGIIVKRQFDSRLKKEILLKNKYTTVTLAPQQQFVWCIMYSGCYTPIEEEKEI